MSIAEKMNFKDVSALRAAKLDYTSPLTKIERECMTTTNYIKNALIQRDIPSIKRFSDLDIHDVKYLADESSDNVLLLHKMKLLNHLNVDKDVLEILFNTSLSYGYEDGVIWSLSFGQEIDWMDEIAVTNPDFLLNVNMHLNPFPRTLIPNEAFPPWVVRNFMEISDVIPIEMAKMWIMRPKWCKCMWGSIREKITDEELEIVLNLDKAIEAKVDYIKGRVPNYIVDMDQILHLRDKDYVLRVLEDKDLVISSISANSICLCTLPCDVTTEVETTGRALGYAIEMGLVNNIKQFEGIYPAEVLEKLYNHNQFDAVERVIEIIGTKDAVEAMNVITNDKDYEIVCNKYNVSHMLKWISPETVMELVPGTNFYYKLISGKYPKFVPDYPDFIYYRGAGKEVRSRIINYELVREGLINGDTTAYSDLNDFDKSKFKIEVLRSGDLFEINRFEYTIPELEKVFGNLHLSPPTQVYEHFKDIMGDWMIQNSKLLTEIGVISGNSFFLKWLRIVGLLVPGVELRENDLYITLVAME